MGEIWNLIVLNPIFNILVIFYQWTSNLGVAILLFTLTVRFILIPLTLPAIKMSKKQRDIQPELNKLKEKYGSDKKKMAEMQMEVFKKHGINPGAGCLTTLLTFVLMIAIYRSVTMFTNGTSVDIMNTHIYFEQFKLLASEVINTSFLYLNLAKPDPYLAVTIIAVALQFIATKMLMPYTEMEEKASKQTPGQMDDFMASMQKQNLYMMPIMFFIFGLTLPSGVMLYIIATTAFQIGQTYYSSGWGGLKPWISKLKFAKKNL
jgi:YidC/Oxa1 family membrane protein insertase